jgi:hypothetical protein
LLGFEQRAGRTADPIGLRACFSAVDCSSTVRSWGWNRSTTSRPIKAWGASGQLVRTPGLNGRSMFTARTPDVPQVCDAVAVLVSPSAKSLVIPTVSLPVQSAAQGEHLRDPALRAARRIGEAKDAFGRQPVQAQDPVVGFGRPIRSPSTRSVDTSPSY